MVIKLTREEQELYPEHKKLESIKDKKNIVIDFLEWLSYDTDYVFGTWTDDDLLMPANENTETLLSEYFKIDLNKLETEKRAMLDSIRSTNKK